MKNKKIILLMLILITINFVNIKVDAKAAVTKFERVGSKKVTLKVGENRKLKLRKRNIKNVKWVSKNKRIVTVSNKGLVTAKKQGKTNVIVKSKVKSGIDKNKVRKVCFKVVVKSTSGSAISTNEGRFNKKTEKGVEEWMSSYDDPKYANFADYPYLDKKYNQICGFNRMILQKNWELVPSYIRGACLYNKIKIKFINEKGDSGLSGYGLADYDKNRITIGFPFNNKSFSIPLSHEMAHIYHFQLKQYIHDISFEKEYKQDKNKYGNYGSTSKYEFFAEKIKVNVIQNKSFVDINYINNDIINNSSLIQYKDKYYILISGDRYIIPPRFSNENDSILGMKTNDFFNYLYEGVINYMKNKGYEVSKVLWENSYHNDAVVNLGKLTDL